MINHGQEAEDEEDNYDHDEAERKIVKDEKVDSNVENTGEEDEGKKMNEKRRMLKREARIRNLIRGIPRKARNHMKTRRWRRALGEKRPIRKIITKNDPGNNKRDSNEATRSEEDKDNSSRSKTEYSLCSCCLKFI